MAASKGGAGDQRGKTEEKVFICGVEIRDEDDPAKKLAGWGAYFPNRADLTGKGRCALGFDRFEGIINAKIYAMEQALKHDIKLALHVTYTWMTLTPVQNEEMAELGKRVEVRKVLLNPETDPANRGVVITDSQRAKFGLEPHPGLRKAYELAIDGARGPAVVYTDGSCPNNGQPNAYAGFGVYWPHFRSLRTSAPLDGPIQTSSRAELMAAIVALEQASKQGLKYKKTKQGIVPKLTIFTDSTYVQKSVTEWIPVWKGLEWKRPSGEEVKNLDLIKSLDQLDDKVKPHWSWVKSHFNDRGNEMADKLARQGAEKHPRALAERVKKM